LHVWHKNPFQKQIIIFISMKNSERVIVQANKHITNINRLLKGVKSKIFADYICSDNKRIVITTNKITVSSDLNIVEKYIEELNDIISLRLSQFKFYLKILSIFWWHGFSFLSLSY